MTTHKMRQSAQPTIDGTMEALAGHHRQIQTVIWQKTNPKPSTQLVPLRGGPFLLTPHSIRSIGCCCRQVWMKYLKQYVSKCEVEVMNEIIAQGSFSIGLQHAGRITSMRQVDKYHDCTNAAVTSALKEGPDSATTQSSCNVRQNQQGPSNFC